MNPQSVSKHNTASLKAGGLILTAFVSTAFVSTAFVSTAFVSTDFAAAASYPAYFAYPAGYPYGYPAEAGMGEDEEGP